MTQLTRRQTHSKEASYIRTYGPVEIPEEVFLEYAREDGPNYSDPATIFSGWTNENNSDMLRRCMIRDIVHQTKIKTYPYTNDDVSCYYITPSCIHVILIEGAGSKEALRKLLRTRPKLLQELTEEFLFHLDSETRINAGYLKNDHRETYDCVIEILLSVIADEELGRQLWSYHYLKPRAPGGQSSFDYPARLFPLITDAAQAPEWLRNDILKFLGECFRYPTEKKDPSEFLPGSDMLHDHRNYWNFRDVFDNLPHSYDEGKLTDHDLCVILKSAEDNLPANGTYLRRWFAIKILPTLSDESTAIKVARRHAIADAINYQKNPAVLDELRTREGRVFLYWLHGAISYHTPADHEGLKSVHELIAQTATKN